MEKRCSACKLTKNFREFNKSKSTKDGYHFTCKLCRKTYNEKVKDKKKEYNSKYWEEKKDILLIKNKNYRDSNKTKINKQRSEYRSRDDVKKHISEKNREYLPIRKAKIKEKRKVDFNFRLSEVLRSKIHKMLNGKKTSYQHITGCDIDTLKKWLEFQFDSNMNWSNFGTYWQIDHVIPISIFDFEKERDKRVCFRWKNLQPLKKEENQSKSNILVLPYVFNSIITAHRFIQNEKLNHEEYQNLVETLDWLREKTQVR